MTNVNLCCTFLNMIKNNPNNALKIIQGVLGFTNAEMSELLGYKDLTMYSLIRSGKRKPRPKVFEIFYDCGLNPLFVSDLNEALLIETTTIPGFIDRVSKKVNNFSQTG